MDEVEIKIMGIDPARIRKILKQHKAKTVKKVLQKNTVYGNHYTKEHDITLRIREEGKHAVITVKGKKRVVNGHKVAEEHETPVDAGVVKEMLRLLGYTPRRYTEMKREYYALYRCSVEIIQVPGYPHYLEIEGDPAGIAKVAKLLGYDKKDYDTRTIFEIFEIKPGDLRF